MYNLLIKCRILEGAVLFWATLSVSCVPPPCWFMTRFCSNDVVCKRVVFRSAGSEEGHNSNLFISWFVYILMAGSDDYNLFLGVFISFHSLRQAVILIAYFNHVSCILAAQYKYVSVWFSKGSLGFILIANAFSWNLKHWKISFELSTNTRRHSLVLGNDMKAIAVILRTGCKTCFSKKKKMAVGHLAAIVTDAPQYIFNHLRKCMFRSLTTIKQVQCSSEMFEVYS